MLDTPSPGSIPRALRAGQRRSPSPITRRPARTAASSKPCSAQLPMRRSFSRIASRRWSAPSVLAEICACRAKSATGPVQVTRTRPPVLCRASGADPPHEQTSGGGPHPDRPLVSAAILSSARRPPSTAWLLSARCAAAVEHAVTASRLRMSEASTPSGRPPAEGLSSRATSRRHKGQERDRFASRTSSAATRARASGRGRLRRPVKSDGQHPSHLQTSPQSQGSQG